MKKTWKSSVLLLGIAMLGAVALSGTNAMAGDVDLPVDVTVTTSLVETPVTDLSFGSLDLNPAGDTVTIDASGSAIADDTDIVTAIDVLNGSVSTTATSGLVTIASTADMNIDVVYPATVALIGTTGDAIGAPDLALVDIAANSVGGAGDISKTGLTDATIHVGGEIVFPANTATGLYEGTMVITFNYLP